MKTGSKRELISIQFETLPNYKQNLEKLIELVKKTSNNSIVVAPEVCLTGFDYLNFDAAALFAKDAINELFKILEDRVLIFTLIEKINSKFYNSAKVLHVNKIVHSQNKSKLFKLGDEDNYFSDDSSEKIVIFEIENIKMAILICFELRFKDLWKRVEGANIIAVPARWGKLREQNFISLTNALAIINQCYVIASDSTNDDATSQSAVISPFGIECRSEELNRIIYDEKEVLKMRRYMDVGIG
ncbi:MAG: carbon-nitrogen hydrolase family protein [Campylobacterota bacterium]|nr:carbon-nitrogen hydrolase family protein [Campylobacterota bacterium]